MGSPLQRLQAGGRASSHGPRREPTAAEGVAGEEGAHWGAVAAATLAVFRVPLSPPVAAVTCLLGSLVPDFPLLADIIGNLVMTLVGFVLPVALYTALFWRTMPWYAWVLGALSVVFGLVTCVFGTIASVEHLIANI